MIHRSHKRPFVSIGLWLLTLLLVLSGGLSTAMSVSAQDTSPPSADTDLDSPPVSPGALNFSNPNSEATVELTASAFLRLLTGEAVSSTEATYVDSMLVEHPFMYGDAIPPRLVETDFAHNTLTVIASPHSYVAVNGETVTWIPNTAYLGDHRIPLAPDGEGSTFTGQLSDIPESTDASLEIRYSCQITVPVSESDLYLNYAWSYADQLIRERTEYGEQLAAYEAYQTYLSEKATYDRAFSEWQTYLSEKNKYDTLQAEYLAYEAAMTAYRRQLAAYEAYQTALADYHQQLAAYEAAYTAYVAAQNAYQSALPIYETYQAQVAQVVDCLTTLNSCFLYNSRGKQLYATLIGDTVATVVDKKSELVDVGKCDPRDIDTSAAATAALQDLLTQYKELTTLPEQFAFYQAHYSEIQKNFSDLYGCLRSLYNNDIVKSTLINYEKLERYIEFLSQLYVVSTGLDDDKNRAEPQDWVIYGRYDSAYYGDKPHRYNTELEPEQIPPDKNNADPTGLTCPSAHVSKPQPPAPLTVTRPIMPAEVVCPIEPDAVLKPTEPTPVAKPVEPTPVTNPGEKPVAPIYTPLQQEMIAACESGTLFRRATGETKTLTFETALSKRLSLQNERPVEFYDADGKTLLWSTELDDGATITFGGTTPTRPDTDKYTYRFVGWKDQDGQLLSELGVVDEKHESFYASYEATLRNYTVTWRIAGAETSVVLPYGTVPVYDGTPEQASTEQYHYRFAGWDKDLTALVGDVTYEALFEAFPRRYTVTWVYAEGNSSSAEWDYGTLPAPDKAPTRPADTTYIYTFTAWDNEPTVVTGDITYTACYDALPILPSLAPDGSDAPPQTVEITDDAYTATIPVEGLRMDRLLTLAKQTDRTITLLSSNGVLSLTLNRAAVTDLAAKGCTQVSITDATDARAGNGPTGYDIRITDADGQLITPSYAISLAFRQANAYTKVYDKKNPDQPLPCTFADGILTLKLNQSAVLHFRNEYPVTVLPCENAVLSADRTVALLGDTVTLTLTCADELAATLTVVGQLTGTVYPVTPANGILSFPMPDEPVEIRATTERKTFTVTFIVDGVVLSEKVYFLGDTVEVPADPQKANDGKTVYTFTGWSPVVTSVTGDATYTAVFRESTQGDSQDYIPPYSRNRAYILYIEIALVLSLIIAIPIVSVILVKRHKRKKKAQAVTPANTSDPPAKD